jgi:hypothetical protein
MGFTGYFRCRSSLATNSPHPRSFYLFLIVLFALPCSVPVRLQAQNDDRPPPPSAFGPNVSELPAGPDSVEGTVLNGVTHEPVARALVFSSDNRYATLTDDRGHFEFKFPPQEAPPPAQPTPNDADTANKLQRWYARNSRPSQFFARKPDYLQDSTGASISTDKTERAQITLTLQPESLIVGHVQFASTESSNRVPVHLYRQNFSDGAERWDPVNQVNTWADGEFRFADLIPGLYRVFTGEQLERDSATFNPQNQLFGFSPVFYPNASDFAASAPISVAAGAKVDVSIRVAKRPYYAVKIAVTNPPSTRNPMVNVFPQAHPGPGYSLGFDPSRQAVMGTLPDGTYTLQVFDNSGSGGSGTLNFTVRGGPSENQSITVLPNASLTVKLIREISSTNPPEQDIPAGPIPNTAVNASLEPTNLVPGQMAPPPSTTGSPDQITFENIAQGSYWLNIDSSNFYVASALWQSRDVLHQPFFIGPAATGVPIEVTLRNDGASVNGRVAAPQSTGASLTDTAVPPPSQAVVYFIPLDSTNGEYRQTFAGSGTFEESQIPPGTYRVVAFDKANDKIGRANPEAARQYDDKGIVLTLAPGQSVQLSSPLIVVTEP